jgi:hypothetical protein
LDKPLEQKGNAMKYVEPEITFLGDACHVILLLGKGAPATIETDRSGFDPAHDLDE